MNITVRGRKLSLRGRSFIGKVVRMDMQKTATIELERSFYIKKYERYEKRISRFHVHKPDNINIKIGDLVEFKECRPISKTKNFVIINKVKDERS